jgi:hypothetical protein
MEKFDITKVNIFSIENLKRGELANIHSLLLFIYSKFDSNPEISLRYCEINWMNRNTSYQIIHRLNELKLINLLETPSKQKPLRIKLKPNHELHYILNSNKRVEFEKYKDTLLTPELFKESIGCNHLNEHFIEATVPSWMRNVNNKVWDLYKFLTVTKIVSYFSSDHKIKTMTVNKYSTKKMPFLKTISFLYDTVPENRKEILYSQFNNAAEKLNLSHDKSFCGIVSNYLEYVK